MNRILHSGNVDDPSLSLLLVDDEPTTLEFETRAVEMMGDDRYHTAASAQELFAALAQQRFDLVLLDLDLGDRVGTSILHEVRVMAPQSLVAVVTGDENPDTVSECIAKGAFDFVAKPISVARVGTILAKARQHIALRSKLDRCESDETGSLLYEDPPGHFLTLREVEARHSDEALSRSAGDRVRAAAILGVPESRLLR
jgi:DNA-binding NtrC family response regulator